MGSELLTTVGGAESQSVSPEIPQKSKMCGFPRCNVTWPCFKAFFLKHFLVIGLVSAVAFALACPWPGEAVNSVKVGSWRVFQTINIVTIFIISGLTLKTDHIKDAARQWLAALTGIISIMLITPCAAFVLVLLPFNPDAYKYGLAIFALVPTTIASGITLVTAARGNAALALMLTVITNVLAVFILPFTVPLVISQAQNVTLNRADMLIKLVMTILVPLIIGKVLREICSWVRDQVTKHKVALGLLNNGSLICIVWQTLSAAQEQVVHTAFGTLCLIALAAILLHVVYLIVNYIVVKIMRMPHREAAAVLIMGSEKTLPMCVAVIAALPPDLGSVGQLTVPCVLAHISQVLIDAFLAEKIGRIEKARSEKAKLALPQTTSDVVLNEPSAADDKAASLISSGSTSKLTTASDTTDDTNVAEGEGNGETTPPPSQQI